MITVQPEEILVNINDEELRKIVELAATLKSWELTFEPLTWNEIRQVPAALRDSNLVHLDTGAALVAGKSAIFAAGYQLHAYVMRTVGQRFRAFTLRQHERVDYLRPLYAGICPTCYCSIASQAGKTLRIVFRLVDENNETLMQGSMLVVPH